MSLRIPVRRLARPAVVFNGTLNGSFLPIRTLTSSTSRKAEDPDKNDKNWNPILAQFNEKQEKENKPLPSRFARPNIPTGSLPPTSIFDVVPEVSPAERREMEKQAAKERTQKMREEGLEPEFSHDAPAKAEAEDSKKKLDRHIAAFALDPFPEKRRLWERKQVIRTIKRRGRLTKNETLARTERKADFKSPFFNTSVKKLTKLANQIAGKPIEQALVQMRFSKKKVAREVLKMLEMGRDTAIVKHGMGLGKAEGRMGEEVTVEDKYGKKRIVRDQTQIYVDQAWVGRGEYTNSWVARARGKADIIRHPKTSISFVLKEEATRIRLSEEYKKKRDNRKLWVQLPDRPITAQRQYALW